MDNHNFKDYYEILGVDRKASPEEIKRAYHRLAHKYHPDKGGDEEKFKEMNEAYQVLSDREKRAQYDRLGEAFQRGYTGQGGGFSGFGPQGFHFDFSSTGQGFEDIIEQLENLFNLNRNPGSFFWRQQSSVRDIQVSIKIPLAEVLTSQVKKITLNKQVICPRCKGTGAEPGTKMKECPTCRGKGQIPKIQQTVFGSFARYSTCPKCQGKGKIPEKPCNVCQGKGIVENREEIKIPIPAGVDNGQILKFPGQGNAGPLGQPAGDLYVKIIVDSDPRWQRRGDDLFQTVEIPLSKAILGGKLKLTTLGGKDLSITVPTGIQSGEIIKIKKA